MPNVAMENLSGMTIITVPGLDGSGPDHWQSRWDFSLSNCQRVQMGDWAYPIRSNWVDRLDREIRRAPNPVVFAAHSLGCLAVAWWAKEKWSLLFQQKVAGALLVAPPDVERPDDPERIQSFSPIPREPLPFPTLLVASRNDAYSAFETSRRIAAMWGSQFIDVGSAGHINAESGLGHWPEGLALLSSMSGRSADRSPSPCAWPTVEVDSGHAISKT